MWNSFERITWSFQKRLAGRVLDRADQRRRRPPRRRPPRGPAQQPPVPLDVAQERDRRGRTGRRRSRRSEAFREVRRVERLQGVEDDDGGQDPGAARRAAGRAARWACGRPRRLAAPVRADSGRASTAAGDHEVERDEQVRGVAAGVERDAERERGDDRQGQQDRPAAEGEARAAEIDERRRAPRATSGRGRRAGRRSGCECHWSPRIRTGKRTSAASIAAERPRPGGSRIAAAAAAAASRTPAPARKSLIGLRLPRPRAARVQRLASRRPVQAGSPRAGPGSGPGRAV